VNSRLNRVLERAFVEVMDRVAQDGISHRTAAMAIGVAKVRAAKLARGLFP
jgi:glutamate dehydrogenase (NAD(P)+)